MVTRLTTALMAMAIALLFAAQAKAQTAAEFADLARHLNAGDHVRVIDRDGVRLDGTVQSVSPDTLVVVGPAGPRAFTPATTARVATRGDSVLTGGLVGFIPGFLLGQQLPDAISEQREPASSGLKAGLITGAIGAAIGMAIDAAREGESEIYVAGRRTAATVTPVVTRARAGAFAQSSLAAVPAADGQDAATPPTRGDRRWSIAVDPLGGVFAGGAGDLEEAMRSAHFGDASRGFGIVSHPYSTRGCQVVLVLNACGEKRLPAVELDRRLSRPWSIAMLFSRMPVGATTGYHGAADQYLTLEEQVDSLGALLSTGGRRGQIGIGPALHVTRIRTGGLPFGVESGWVTRTTLGFMARARATVPARSRVFLDLRVEYHFTGRVPVGPYASIPIFAGSPVTFPATSARFNYWFVGLGPGLRF